MYYYGGSREGGGDAPEFVADTLANKLPPLAIMFEPAHEIMVPVITFLSIALSLLEECGNVRYTQL